MELEVEVEVEVEVDEVDVKVEGFEGLVGFDGERKVLDRKSGIELTGEAEAVTEAVEDLTEPPEENSRRPSLINRSCADLVQVDSSTRENRVFDVRDPARTGILNINIFVVCRGQIEVEPRRV